MLEAVRARSEVDAEEWQLLRPGGEGVHAEVSCRDLRNDRAIHGLVVTLRDVTARRGLERELSHRTSHDALTGLANRDSFRQLAEEAIGVPTPGRVVAAVHVDLDDFKIINETMGYDTGDQVLVTIGHRLADILGEHDLAARIGADEFALLLFCTAKDPTDIDTVAARVVGIFADPIDASGSPVRVTASVGIATSAEAADAGDLLRQADLALFVAKTEGKNRWRRYHPQQHEAVLERHELRRELAEALDSEQLSLVLQPIAELRGGRVHGLEALVRWTHPTRGMISPDRFVAVAEESGQIARLGSWVLRHSLAQAAQLRERGSRDIYVSVNVSAHQFRTPGFADEVHAGLASCELPAAALVLEITESLFLEGDEQVWHDLAALRRDGVRIAIDDFGTGYSSLSYLHRVPVDVVKIDRSFVDGVATDPQRRKLVDGILRLAASLDLETIAEGVETEPDRDLLAQMGCQFGQGYLYAKPLDLAAARRGLDDHESA
jgi:diguanylate cyclase (GGDEF)-like protein